MLEGTEQRGMGEKKGKWTSIEAQIVVTKWSGHEVQCGLPCGPRHRICFKEME